jgi:hypothetical protein
MIVETKIISIKVSITVLDVLSDIMGAYDPERAAASVYSKKLIPIQSSVFPSSSYGAHNSTGPPRPV